MTRNYVAVAAALPHRPKFRRLSIPARAALFTVWCDAVTRTPEAIWRDRASILDVLDLDGFGPEVLDELIARGWLDLLEDGRIAVHDWDEHQVALSAEMTRAYEAARKLDWRNRQKGRTLSPDPSPVGEVRGGEGRVSPIVRDTSGTSRGHENTDGSKEPTKKNGPESVLTGRVPCPDYTEHQLAHYFADGQWRCRTCETPA